MADYLIHLRPTARCRVPGIIALRRLLKTLGRVYGLEAVDVSEVQAQAEKRASVRAMRDGGHWRRGARLSQQGGWGFRFLREGSVDRVRTHT